MVACLRKLLGGWQTGQERRTSAHTFSALALPCRYHRPNVHCQFQANHDIHTQRLALRANNLFYMFYRFPESTRAHHALLAR